MSEMQMMEMKKMMMPMAAHDAVAKQTARALQLLDASAKKSYDPLTDIDWTAPLVDGKWFLPERMCSLYGTEMWDRMSLEQKMALSREELAANIAVGVWTEHMLMQMVARYVYDRDITQPSVQYALTEVADEVRHMMMFARTVEKMGCAMYPVPWKIRESGRLLKTFAPVGSLWALILLTERMFDRVQREIAKDETVQPVIREMCRIHCFEESRHISFARAELDTFVPQMGAPARFAMQVMLGMTVKTIATETFNPEMYRRAGVADWKAARAAALANPNNRALFKFAAKEIADHYFQIGLIGNFSGRLWAQAGFI